MTIETLNGAAPAYGLPPGSVALVLGERVGGRVGEVSLRPLDPLRRGKRMSKSEHLALVRRRILDAQSAGATHLVVPRPAAGWLEAHPAVSRHLAETHDVAPGVGPDGEAAIVFTLRDPEPARFVAEVDGWTVRSEAPLRLTAERDLDEPQLVLRCVEPAVGTVRCTIRLRTEGLDTLRVRFAFRLARDRAVHVSLRDPEQLVHEAEFAEVRLDSRTEDVTVDVDVAIDPGDLLVGIRIGPFTDGNWRVHPGFPGGRSFALPDRAPAGSRLEVLAIDLRNVPEARKSPIHGRVVGPRRTPRRKPAGKLRDAVVFASWVPEEGLELGAYFLDLLARHHADSRIFVGVNHGSSPVWSDRLRKSGLDLEVCPAAPTLTMPYDPTGFVAALDRYRRSDERFDLVWFGHNKGGIHLQDEDYPFARWVIEREFWNRRAAVEAVFDRPEVGVWAPHYLMFQPEHQSQTDALERISPGICRPLCAMAVSTHFVMRDAALRQFCAEADPRFWTHGAEAFGGDRFFFEMAFPNVPIVQGYEPHVGDGVGGTLGEPAAGETLSILNDWRQNHAIVRRELERWRAHPTTFRPDRHAHHRVP